MFAVKVGAVAIPCAFVASGGDVAEPPAKVPLAPLAGAVKITFTPGTALPLASVTVAEREVANTVLIGVPCGVPPVAVTEAGGPGLLVSEKFAGVAAPVTEAVTV